MTFLFRPARPLFLLLLTCLALARPAAAQDGTFGFDGKIVNANSLRPIIADMSILGPTQKQVGQLTTDRTGTFSVTAETAGDYRFAVSALGYVSQEVTHTARAGAPVAFTVALVPLATGAKVILSTIRFAKSKAELLPESFDELARLANLLQANERMEIQLNGHTDNQGDAAANQKLSEDRVRAVQDYLVVRRGIAAARLRGQGFGGAQPIAPNTQEVTRKLNRRVEFKITKK